MAARFRDFDAAEAERKGEPITFRLGGREWVAEHVNAANFLAFSRKIAAGGTEAVTAFDDYITGTLGEEEREPFHAMLAATEVQLSTLMELATWIVEQATGKPTAAASPSAEPPSSPGQPRKLVLASLDPTPQTSPSAAGS